MSYDIYIGEAEADMPTQEELDESNEPGWYVKGFSHPEAPEFPGDTMTGKGNGRHPGYSQWSDFCRMAGIYDLFFGARYENGKYVRDTGLMTKHPGCFLLRASDLLEVRQARERWEAKAWPVKERIPGWDPNLTPFAQHDGDPRYDNILARLIWLEWWMNWALTNCKVPAIYNR